MRRIAVGERVKLEDSHSTWTVETSSEPGEPPLRMLRVGKGIEHMDREFDEFFWQRLGSDAISRAACELVELYLAARGRAEQSPLSVQADRARFSTKWGLLRGTGG